jgi:hypothetical protein
MHHRPVRLGMLAGLREKQGQIDSLLKSAKKELTPEERAEARADGERTQQVLSAWSWLRDMQLQSAQLDPKFVGMFQETFSSPHTSLAKMADDMLRVDPKLVEMLDRTRQQAFALSEPSFSQMLKQTQSMELAFKAAWNPVLLEQSAAVSEMHRRAAFAMMDAMRPHLETLMRERDRMADVMKPYFETLMRERDRLVENHGSPAVPRSEPEDTESKRAQKDEDDKRIPS